MNGLTLCLLVATAEHRTQLTQARCMALTVALVSRSFVCRFYHFLFGVIIHWNYTDTVYCVVLYTGWAKSVFLQVCHSWVWWWHRRHYI